jgi:hypothetical protein
LTVETVIVLPPVTAEVGIVIPVLTKSVTVLIPVELSTVNSKEVPLLTVPPSCVAIADAVGSVMFVIAALVLVI